MEIRWVFSAEGTWAIQRNEATVGEGLSIHCMCVCVTMQTCRRIRQLRDTISVHKPKIWKKCVSLAGQILSGSLKEHRSFIVPEFMKTIMNSWKIFQVCHSRWKFDHIIRICIKPALSISSLSFFCQHNRIALSVATCCKSYQERESVCESVNCIDHNLSLSYEFVMLTFVTSLVHKLAIVTKRIAIRQAPKLDQTKDKKLNCLEVKLCAPGLSYGTSKQQFTVESFLVFLEFIASVLMSSADGIHRENAI